MSAPINSAKAAALLAEVAPAVARVELYPQWSDGSGEVVRRTRAIPYDDAGRIVELSDDVRREVCAVLRRLGDVDLDVPQSLDVAAGKATPTYVVVITLPEALLSPAVDAYRTAQLDAQRHELEDPAEPPLAVRAVVEPDAARDFARSVRDGFVTPVEWNEIDREAEAAWRDLGRDVCDPPTAPDRETVDVPVQGDAL